MRFFGQSHDHSRTERRKDDAEWQRRRGGGQVQAVPASPIKHTRSADGEHVVPQQAPFSGACRVCFLLSSVYLAFSPPARRTGRAASLGAPRSPEQRRIWRFYRYSLAELNFANHTRAPLAPGARHKRRLSLSRLHHRRWPVGAMPLKIPHIPAPGA